MDAREFTKLIQKAVGRRQVLIGHPIVMENAAILTHEMDVVSINQRNLIYEFEVKISKSDFLADRNKRKNKFFDPVLPKYCPNYFSYVCPGGLIEIPQIPKYAGLYYYKNGEVVEVCKPKLLHKEVVLNERMLAGMLRLYSERQFLEMAKLTYINKAKKENYLRNENEYNY